VSVEDQRGCPVVGLYQTSLGYDPHDLMVATLNLTENTYRDGPAAPRLMSACGIA
jgi:hypothetical protein